MPVVAVEQKRNFTKSPLGRFTGIDFPKPVAAPLYETKPTFKTNPTWEQFLSDWVDHLRTLSGSSLEKKRHNSSLCGAHASGETWSNRIEHYR